MIEAALDESFAEQADFRAGFWTMLIESVDSTIQAVN